MDWNDNVKKHSHETFISWCQFSLICMGLAIPDHIKMKHGSPTANSTHCNAFDVVSGQLDSYVVCSAGIRNTQTHVMVSELRLYV